MSAELFIALQCEELPYHNVPIAVENGRCPMDAEKNSLRARNIQGFGNASTRATLAAD